jgi:hypothetical protein
VRNGLLNVVNGIEINPRPTDATCHQVWLQKDSIAKSYIILNLGDNQVEVMKLRKTFNKI